MNTQGLRDGRIGVVGIGTLGTTLVQLGLDQGLDLVAVHRSGPGKRDRAVAAIERSMQREVDRGRMPAETATERLDRLVVTDDYRDLADCGIVLEATQEDLAAKHGVIAEIERSVTNDAIIASSTSSLPANALAAEASHPGRVVVAHYIWPANRMPVVEVSVPADADDQVAERVDAFLSAQGKEQLRVSDTLGFYVTRVLYVYWSRMASLLACGLGPDEIDGAMQAAGWRMGPCRLIDGTGIESVLQIFDVVRPALGDRADDMDRLRPLVAAGFVGGTDAPGLYDHSGSEPVPNTAALELIISSSAPKPAEICRYLEQAFIDETKLCLDEGVVASWEQAALGVDGAYGFPGGLVQASSRV